MTLELNSPCKVNLLLNILRRRDDGFHELETLMHPVQVHDRLTFKRGGNNVQLTCSLPGLPTDARNLVHRAATAFLDKTRIREGVVIHLDKHIPLAAGLGGGSGNAATTLLALNQIFGTPLASQQLEGIAASLGSDVPFFLQSKPALATGRGENVQPLESFPALRGAGLLLVHPGFGIETAWAYRQLARFPHALNGMPGRAAKLVSLLQASDLAAAGREFYNSLEAPALEKFPLLVLFQDFFRENGALATLMSGSGSTTFAITKTPQAAQTLAEAFKLKFGNSYWLATVPL